MAKFSGPAAPPVNITHPIGPSSFGEVRGRADQPICVRSRR
jgi:hypothetical protein